MASMSSNDPSRRCVLGCVSFLNARPLTDGLEADPALKLQFDVPSRLLDGLLTGDSDIALCPVVDFQVADEPLAIIPAGGIGCDGPTLTVRLYARAPLEQVRTLGIDTDSHTSVVLARLILAERYGIEPAVSSEPTRDHDALLLIGDKVVTHAPDENTYPHQLDLGEAWFDLTGLPFVFAVWMCKPDTPLANVPQRLSAQREHNAGCIDAIVLRHAESLGWPDDLARHYLGTLLRYAIGPRELEAMQQFWTMAHTRGYLPRRRPLVVRGAPGMPCPSS